MSGESVAQDQIKAFVDRILRMKEERKAIDADIREIYAEAKGSGFDKTVLGKLVNYVERRAADANAVMESESLFDLYLTAYDSAVSRPHAHAYARASLGITPEHDAETGEITEPQSAPQAARDLAAPPSPQGRVALPSQAKASTDGDTTAQDIEIPADSVTGEASRASVGAGSVASIQPETEAPYKPRPFTIGPIEPREAGGLKGFGFTVNFGGGPE